MYKSEEKTMREKAKSCCFTGHRNLLADEELDIDKLIKEIDQAVWGLRERGYDTFYVGGALGFDTLAAQRLLKMRDYCPSWKMEVILVMPCRNQARGWMVTQKEAYRDIQRRVDEVICLQEEYTSGCMHVRNRFMVDHSSACIAYCHETRGGTAYTVKYARQKGLEIIML